MCDDIELLRQKLIEDINNLNEGSKWIWLEDVISIIDKRFRGE